jgi:hypothetical protein
MKKQDEKKTAFLADLDREMDPQCWSLLSEQNKQSSRAKLDAIRASEAVIKRLKEKLAASL